MRLPTTMGTRLTVVGLLALAAQVSGGCANAQAHPEGTAVTIPSPTRWPAATEGGACYLLDYDVIERLVGVSFDVAAASVADDTFTCVLQQNSGNSYPDLTLSVTPVDADAAVFKATVQPRGATPVAGLGKIGYAASLPATGGTATATGGTAAVTEVGWLSGNDRLLVLRYRGPLAGGPDERAALAGKLTALAKEIDQNGL
jgi:hypothetical protein